MSERRPIIPMPTTTTALCHSEERSDEESRFLDLKRQRNNEILRSLWSLRMTIQATAVVVLRNPIIAHFRKDSIKKL